MAGARSKSKSGSQGEESEFVQEVLNSRPTFTNNAAASDALKAKLARLAEKHGKSIEAFVNEAESASLFNEDFVEAINLSRQIRHLDR